MSVQTQTQKALYVDQDSNFSVRTDIPIPTPEGNELLIEGMYSGVNPADIKHATILGIRATTLGYDFCGRIASTPPTSEFQKGDIVAGYTPSGPGLNRALKYGTHKRYFTCPDDQVFKVPANLPESHAATLAVVVMTATDVAYNFFKFPLPDASAPPKDSLSPVLIWGASSGVGIATLQFVRASGYRNVLVTASPARHELLKSLGASQCFDYSSATVVTDIKAAVDALGQGPILHALDAVGSKSPPASAELVAQCVPDPNAVLVSSVIQNDKRFQMPFAMKKDDWWIQLEGAPEPMVFRAKVDEHWRAWGAMLWAVENYGKGFRFPVVDVWEGTAEGALEEIGMVADGKRAFGRLVVRQPMN